LSQLPTLLGISAHQSDHFLLDIWQVLTHIDAMHEMSVAFGVSAIILLVGFKNWRPACPAC